MSSDRPDEGKVFSNTNEVFGNHLRATGSMRIRATLMEEKAGRLLKEAREWRYLADLLDEVEKQAANQSVGGSEGGLHIGVGSAPENLLWKLATGSQENL